MIIHSKNQSKRAKCAWHPDRSHRFCYPRSFRLHIWESRNFLWILFSTSLSSARRMKYSHVLSVISALSGISAFCLADPVRHFCFASAETILMFLPRYFPLYPDIVYSPQYNHPWDKQIPSLPYDHIERYAPLPRKWINFILGCGGRSSLL